MATETAEHASEGGSFPPFDQLDTFPSQIFWLVVTFGILYFVLASVFLPKIRKAIDDREGSIATDVAAAAEASEKAETAVQEFETDIAKAKAAARDTASKAKAEADAKVAAETAKVEADLAKKLEEAESRILEVRTKAMANVSGVAEDTASAIVEQLVGVKADPAALKTAVAGVMGNN